MALQEEEARKTVQETEHASGVSSTSLDMEEAMQCEVEVSVSAEESISILESGLQPPSNTPYQEGIADTGSLVRLRN